MSSLPALDPTIVEVMAQIFRAPPASLGPESSPDTIPTWDSLSHFQLVAALESRFEVRLNLREIQTMDSAGKIQQVLAQRGKVAGDGERVTSNE